MIGFTHSRIYKLLLLFVIALFISQSVTHAQLCTGNLGDPVFNETFGDHFFPPLPKATTVYNYTPGCPKPGLYTIDHLLYGCEKNTWHLLAGDHTKNVEGNYMLVNGENAAGMVYTAAVANLCGNTTYEFATWILNAMKPTACGGKPVHPQFELTVTTKSGTMLGVYNTGLIMETDEKKWQQFGLFFTTPPDINDVVITITNQGQYGCGNAFALDDITVKPCGSQINITLNGEENFYENVCKGYTDVYALQATYSPVIADPVFQWQYSLDTGNNWIDIPGATQLTYSIPTINNGVVIYRFTLANKVNENNKACRIVSKYVWMEVHDAPAYSPPANWHGCLNKDFTLSDNNYALHYLWTYPNGYQTTFAIPVINNLDYTDTGWYTAQLSTEYGCSTIDSFYLQVYPSTTVQTQTEYGLCKGKTVQLSASGDGTFSWSPPQGLSDTAIANPIAAPAVFTQYKVVLTNDNGCKDSAFVNVRVYENLYVSTGGDKQILSGDTVLLNALVTGADEYYWSPPLFISDVHAIQPVVYPPENITYTLHAKSAAGCGNADMQVTVKVFDDVYIPNAFTPNGDGLNDRFRVLKLDDYIPVKLVLYNRQGQLIYQASGQNNGWDGTINNIPQPTGTYVYHVELQNASGRKISRKGTFLLLR